MWAGWTFFLAESASIAGSASHSGLIWPTSGVDLGCGFFSFCCLYGVIQSTPLVGLIRTFRSFFISSCNTSAMPYHMCATFQTYSGPLVHEHAAHRGACRKASPGRGPRAGGRIGGQAGGRASERAGGRTGERWVGGRAGWADRLAGWASQRGGEAPGRVGSADSG